MDFWSNFWNIIWIFLWAFVFVAYLYALFAIIADLFRDDKLNGWWKALWLIFLVFLPFLTALVYLIARGDGMAKRSAAATLDAQQATDSYIRSVAGSGSNAAHEIAKAKELLDAGAISAEEYEKLKARALA
ncbi:SHOCT domain-containing protein [Microbacterium sp.]|uniref:SHOCT domain-containing protein n=1 Tax=Microbacterium sp. TaxID=51671 RepID=UPI003A8BC76E